MFNGFKLRASKIVRYFYISLLFPVKNVRIRCGMNYPFQVVLPHIIHILTNMLIFLFQSEGLLYLGQSRQKGITSLIQWSCHCNIGLKLGLKILGIAKYNSESIATHYQKDHISILLLYMKILTFLNLGIFIPWTIRHNARD